jgi:hypothetical protein
MGDSSSDGQEWWHDWYHRPPLHHHVSFAWIFCGLNFENHSILSRKRKYWNMGTGPGVLVREVERRGVLLGAEPPRGENERAHGVCGCRRRHRSGCEWRLGGGIGCGAPTPLVTSLSASSRFSTSRRPMGGSLSPLCRRRCAGPLCRHSRPLPLPYAMAHRQMRQPLLPLDSGALGGEETVGAGSGGACGIGGVSRSRREGIGGGAAGVGASRRGGVGDGAAGDGGEGVPRAHWHGARYAKTTWRGYKYARTTLKSTVRGKSNGFDGVNRTILIVCECSISVLWGLKSCSSSILQDYNSKSARAPAQAVSL